MKTKSKHTLKLAIAVVLGFWPVPSIIRAQDVKSKEPKSSGKGILPLSPISKEMKQCVYMLDTLADQMVFRYGWEIRSKPRNPDSEALHRHMKAHAKLTNVLIKTSRGLDEEAFKKAAKDARESVLKLQGLLKKTTAGKSVTGMIEKSGPLANYIDANSDSFEAKPLIKIGKIRD